MAIDTTFLRELDKLNLLINKRVTSNYIGQKKSIAVGKGLIFKDHRIYAPGDDVKNIDWKVFARTDDYFIKNYEEERNVAVHIILDISNSMDYGKNISKYEYGAMLALGFAYLAVKGNEKVQFSTFSDEIEIFHPNRGFSQVGSMIRHLNEVKPKGNSMIDSCFKKYRHAIGSKSIMIIISDFLMDTTEIEKATFALGKQELKFVQVLDPVEKNLAIEGEYDLEDSETGLKLKSL